jgi:protein SCO1/2
MTAAHIRLAVVILAGLIAGALAALAILPQARERLLPGPVRTWGEAQIGGPFTLTDHTGRRVSDADFRGRTMLVVFGCTSCPEATAPPLQVLSAALDKLGPRGESFVPVLITVDPAHDTPERLKPFVAGFHSRLLGLTGTQAEIASVVKAYRVPDVSTDAGRGSPGWAALTHPSLIYVMGPNGRFHSVLNYASGVETVAASLAALS